MKVFKLLKEKGICPLSIVILGFCYYISFFNYGISLGDEGFFVYGAERVLEGQLPMSDFTSYPPGSYFLLALLFKVFGVNLLVSRFMEMAFLLMNGLMMFYIGRRLMPSRWALIPSFILILFPGPWHKVFFTFGLLFPLITLIQYLEKKSMLKILTVGWAIGVAFLLKHESALYSILTTVIVLFGDHIWGGGNFTIDRKRISAFCKEIFLCFFALASVATPFIICYYSRSALTKVVYFLVRDSTFANVAEISGFFGKASLIKAFTKFHIGSMQHLFFYLIMLLYFYVFGKFVVQFYRERRKEFPILLSVLIMGALSLSYAYVVGSKAHLLSSGAMSYILFGFVVYSTMEKRGLKSNILLIILALLLGLYLLDNFKGSGHFHSGSISRLYRIRKEGVGLIRSNRASVYVEDSQARILNDFIQFFDGKNGYLLPLDYGPMFNFLTGLENPTRFTILMEFFLKDEMNQNKVIEEIQNRGIKYLLIHRLLWMSRESHGFSTYAPKLYQFVNNRYRIEREIGGYLIFSPQSL
jgi:hypothetical protein